MKNAINKRHTQTTRKTNKERTKSNQSPGETKREWASPYMVTASLVLPVTCIVVYYVISKPSIIITNTQVHLAQEVSGWQRATAAEETKYNTSLCTIEKRDAETLDHGEFERVYR